MCHEDTPNVTIAGDPSREERTTLPVKSSDDLPALIVRPEREPAGGVLIVHDIFGASEFYDDLARRLADAGFLAMLPDFFFRHGPMPSSREDRRARGQQATQADLIGDMSAALGWLKANGSGKIGVLGMCWGGTATMLAAARIPTPNACIPFYGFPAKDATEAHPLRPIDEQEVRAVDAPILGFFGEDDEAVGTDNVAAYDDALTAAGKMHEFVVSPGVGHGFLTFNPADPAYAASQAAWSRTIEFLDDHLR